MKAWKNELPPHAQPPAFVIMGRGKPIPNGKTEWTWKSADEVKALVEPAPQAQTTMPEKQNPEIDAFTKEVDRLVLATLTNPRGGSLKEPAFSWPLTIGDIALAVWLCIVAASCMALVLRVAAH